jgi:hypothetical protein
MSLICIRFSRLKKCCISRRADARTRTGDPFITSEVLYQLSYVGGATTVAALPEIAAVESE